LNIGELAHQTGTSIRSLRYYEAKRLLSSQRQENGYRSYDTTAIERVRTIQYFLGLGLTTREMFDIVFCGSPDEAAAQCDETAFSACSGEEGFYREKLAEVEARIASLEKARIYLTQRLAQMHAQEDV
jgi:MerR family transcriptional regulator, Zn(II)-responsive regulator of zntA